jgi:hypothetical protein
MPGCERSLSRCHRRDRGSGPAGLSTRTNFTRVWHRARVVRGCSHPGFGPPAGGYNAMVQRGCSDRGRRFPVVREPGIGSRRARSRTPGRDDQRRPRRSAHRPRQKKLAGGGVVPGISAAGSACSPTVPMADVGWSPPRRAHRRPRVPSLPESQFRCRVPMRCPMWHHQPRRPNSACTLVTVGPASSHALIWSCWASHRFPCLVPMPRSCH